MLSNKEVIALVDDLKKLEAKSLSTVERPADWNGQWEGYGKSHTTILGSELTNDIRSILYKVIQSHNSNEVNNISERE